MTTTAVRGARSPRSLWYSQARGESARSGNVLDVFPCARERTAMLLADVSGMDLRSERHARSLHRVVRASADANAPARVLDIANTTFRRTMHEYGGDPSFATVFLGMLSGRVMTYASAGCDLGMIVNAAGQHRHLPNTGSLFGVDGSDTYADNSVIVEPGDWLVLVSGGVAYARDRDGEPFGTRGVTHSAIAALAANTEDPAAVILEASRRHAREGLGGEASVLCVELT